MSAIQQAAVTQITSPGNSNYDPYYSSVSLLLSMNGSNNSTSFVDASPNSNIITVNSNAKISTTQFKFGGSSARFNGTADYLTTVDSTLAWGTGDFTVELWMYTDDQIGATQRGPLQTSTTPGGFSTGYTTGIAIFQGSNRNNAPMDGGLIVNIAGTNVGSNSPVISIGVWTHVAIVRSSGNATLYINGTSVDSRTANGSITGTNLVIGGYYSNLFYYIGYIDDLRITSGIARYNSNFTVPAYANPLTGPQYDPFYNNVSLLLHCNGTNASTNFIDNSGSPKTVTANGNAQISTAQWRFGGSSGLFDGNGDYLQLSSSSDLALGSGDLTIEAWIYILNNTGFAVVGTLSFNAGASFRINATAMILDSSGQNSVSRSATISINTWHHVAVTRASGTVRFFLNGIQQGADQTYTQNFSGESRVIGGSVADNTLWFNGYMDDVHITKGVARYTTNFTPPRLAFADSGPNFDPYYDQVTLLLPFNGANASTSFIDSSKTANIISVTGNTQISTAQSKFGGSSVYFDGNIDWLSLPSTNINFQSSDFTIEFWIYRTSNALGTAFSMARDQSGTGYGPVRIDFTTSLTVRPLIGDSNNTGWASTATGTATIALNTWGHYALVKSGTTITQYINGVLDLTLTSMPATFSDVSRDVTIGYNNSTDGQYLTGYLDDFRITKGVARYTTNFTVPVRPNPATGIQYDNYYDNVSLLLHMNGPNNGTSFVDNSLRAKTVTANGNAVTSTTQYKWGVSSAYFDGSGDYLMLPTNALPDLSGAFTYETWWYPTSTTNGPLFGTWNNNASGWGLFAGKTTQLGFYVFWYFGTYGVNQAARGISTDVLTLNAWNHIAVQRDASNVWTFYINGIATATTTYGQNMSWSDSFNFTNSTNPVGIGTSIYSVPPSYMDDVRLTVGIARYTTNFIPPTQAFPDQGPQTDPFYYNTSLLLHFDGTNASTNFIDNSPVIKSVTPSGNAQISTAQSKFGGSSVYFDGTGDSLVVPSSNDFNFGTNPWTIECWVRISADASGVIDVIIGNRSTSFLAGQWYLCYVSSNIVFDFRVGGSDNNSVGATGISFNTWYHIAVVRNGTNYAMYKDGVLSQSLTISSSASIGSSSYNISIGNSTDNSFPLNGYIDDLRITKGVARYVNNFTPPQRPFPNQ